MKTTLLAAGVYGCVILGLAASAWKAAGRSEQPGTIPFVALQGLAAAIASVSAGLLLGVVPEPVFRVAETVGLALFTLLAVFASMYTGRGPTVTRGRAIGIGCFVILHSSVLVLGSPPMSGGLSRAAASVGNIITVFVALAGISGCFLLIWSGLRDEEVPAGAGIVFGVYGLLQFRFVPADHPIGLLQVVLGVALVLFAQFRYQPFEGQPAMAYLTRDSAFDTMDEAVVVVDRNERVADLNTTAERTFGLDLSSVVGRPLETVLGYDPDKNTTDPVSIDTTRGHRSFTVSRSPLTDRDGTPIGETFQFRDVTDEQTREEQLEVFNRILRHNLRNDLDAIRGFAEALNEEEGSFSDTATVAERIHSLSRELSETGATAKRAERLRTRETLVHDQIAVAELLESVAGEFRKRDPHCRVLTDATVQRLRADESILETILFEVVENAVEHHPERAPTVDITATPTDDGVEFVVRDDGDGIPEHEQEVLLNSAPTQQQHSTGIGLWLVSWGVTRLGGELELENADAGGAVVKLSIPDRSPKAARSSDLSRAAGLKTDSSGREHSEPERQSGQSG